MKKYFAILLLLCPGYGFCQTDAPSKPIDKSFIDVIGTATKEVIPDRIFISIILSDKVEDKKEYTIETQEIKLKEALSGIGIDLKQLVLSDAGSQVIRSKARESVFKVSKEYTLEVKNAEEVNSVFKELYLINVKECSIDKTESSQIESVKKEVRMAAVKDAKNKAEYLLEAIGEHLGKPLEIKDQEVPPAYVPLNTYNYRPDMVYDNVGKNDRTIFKKLVVTFSYAIRYSIK